MSLCLEQNTQRPVFISIHLPYPHLSINQRKKSQKSFPTSVSSEKKAACPLGQGNLHIDQHKYILISLTYQSSLLLSLPFKYW